ncbi:hypothetical protein Tco_0459862 [Tanacetum coccineum]
MDAFFEDISANNVPTPPTQTTGPQPAQTTGPNNEFEELLSRSTPSLIIPLPTVIVPFSTPLFEELARDLAVLIKGGGGGRIGW